MFTAAAIQGLNELEFALYNYISQHKEEVVYMRIRDVADGAHVSTTTVLRFCRKLKCSGFAEFKVKLRLYLEAQHPVEVAEDKTAFLEFLDRAASPQFQDNLTKACQLVFAADNVIFVGVGSSGILASYGARYFSSFDKFSVYIDDPFYPAVAGKYLENSVAVVFSVSGDSGNTLQHTIMLKNKKCKIVSITNSKDCTIARLSDCNIAYYAQHEKKGDIDITTQMPVLYLIETMARKIYKMIQEKAPL
jgi:DNA-binding MurR/RpiR family transcriptional regulator